MSTVLYQVHYNFGPGACDCDYYSGDDGNLFTNREAAEEEAEYLMQNEDYWHDMPESYDILEVKVFDSFTKEEY